MISVITLKFILQLMLSLQSHGRGADKCQSSSAETDQRGTRSNSGPAVRKRGVLQGHDAHSQVISSDHQSVITKLRKL